MRVPPPLIALLSAILMWFLAHIMPIAPLTFPLRQIVAIAFPLLGLSLGVASFRAFSQAKTTTNPIKIENASALVTGGPFGYSRNPMYLGLLLILTGLALHLGTVSGLIILPLFIAYINIFQIAPEEEVMRGKFGSDYDAYYARVRRWI